MSVHKVYKMKQERQTSQRRANCTKPEKIKILDRAGEDLTNTKEFGMNSKKKKKK